MKNSVPKLHSIKFKDGSGTFVSPGKTELCSKLVKQAREAIEILEGDVQAFVVIAIDSKLGSATGVYVSDSAPISTIMWPTVVHDIMMRRILNGDMDDDQTYDKVS